MSASRLQRRLACTGPDGWPDHLHPVLRRIYALRDVRSADEVEHRLARMAPPHGLDGLEQATTILAEAIAGGRRILIAGDYDCDGATGTAVAVRGLRMLGARHVDFVVPDRFAHGYGLSAALVASLRQRPDLIVTVDNGIASLDGVAAARARGIDVIVTDHHLPGERLPDAQAIVNPLLVRASCARKSRSGDPSPHFSIKPDSILGNLAGVGVMFYLLLALRAWMREHGRLPRGGEPDLSILLDLVALGTVADLVPLDHNNRVLVEAGLRRIRNGHACPGIAALAAVSGRSTATLVASDFAFALAPRLNAAGRLQDMAQGVACLLADDAAQAQALAERLSAINAERRQLQAGMVAEAEALVAGTRHVDSVGVVVFEPQWHAGVVGLVASRLKERLHRPVVAFAPAGEGSAALRGSARSINGFHMRDALAEVDARCPGLIARFGGHAMAAGLTLERADLARFATAFDAVARQRIGADALDPVLWSDGELAVGELTLELAQVLRYAGPWGQAFPAPLFDNVFDCVRQRPMGVAHRRLALRDPRDGSVFDAVMFNVAVDVAFPPRLRAAYELVVNEWQGRHSPRLLLRHVEPS